MRSVLAAALFLWGVPLAAQDFRAWPGTGFERARIRTVSTQEIYPDGAPSTDLAVPLTLVLLDKTNWTDARALRHIRKTAAIFAPCGISIGDVQLGRAVGPSGKHDVDMTALAFESNIPVDIADLASRIPESRTWPRVFFVGRLLGDKAIARSFRMGEVPRHRLPEFPYMNTAWVAYRAHWTERREDAYSSLAHELAHLLCDCGHSGGEVRHLLHEKRNFLGPNVLPADCRRMRRSDLLQVAPTTPYRNGN